MLHATLKLPENPLYAERLALLLLGQAAGMPRRKLALLTIKLRKMPDAFGYSPQFMEVERVAEARGVWWQIDDTTGTFEVSTD